MAGEVKQAGPGTPAAAARMRANGAAFERLAAEEPTGEAAEDADWTEGLAPEQAPEGDDPWDRAAREVAAERGPDGGSSNARR